MTEPQEDPARRAADAVQEVAAILVGLGVMAVNRVQAVRRQVAATQQSATDPSTSGEATDAHDAPG